MYKINDYYINLLPTKKISLFEDIIEFLEKKGITVVRISPFMNKIEIGILASGKKRIHIEVEGYDYFIKCGKEDYFDYIYESMQKKFADYIINKDEIEKEYNLERSSIMNYIEKNEYLSLVNSYRTRNFILYRNDSMDLIYDTHNKELLFAANIPFSSIEHDSNRKFAEQVCVDLLLDFENSKKKYIKFLSNPYDKSYVSEYEKYIDILNGGDNEFNEDDILVMISILGRLNQESQMGTISVRLDDKLNPTKVIQHDNLKKYIYSCLLTIREYTHLYLSNKEELRSIGNIGFDGKLDRLTTISSVIQLLDFNNLASKEAVVIETKKLKKKKENNTEMGIEKLDMMFTKEVERNFRQPNYIESFFKSVVNCFEERKTIPVIIDNFKDILNDLLSFQRRYIGNKDADFLILAKIKGILFYYDFKVVMDVVTKEIISKSKYRTYYKIVAEYLENLDDAEKQKSEFYCLLNIYETHIIKEIARFMKSKEDNILSEYSDDEIAIVSDMHFNDLNDIYKGNYSKNFNIIAGDFYNNTFHRGGLAITEALDIKGIGVIGNHDVSWINGVSDIVKEVKTNYKETLNSLNKAFPNVKILNNEVYYKDGIAFVGLTIVSDEKLINNTKQKSFFASVELGWIFSDEDYLSTAKKLLDSVDKNTPIVLITHSPFKEYAVCKNKNIGIYSGNLLKEYPNIKIYIHGHGHSYQKSKVIDGILCITNPIINNIYNESSYSINWDSIISDK